MIAAVMKSMDPALERPRRSSGPAASAPCCVSPCLVVPGVLGAAIFVFAEMLGTRLPAAPRASDAQPLLCHPPRRSTSWCSNIREIRLPRHGRVACLRDVLHAVPVRRIVMAAVTLPYRQAFRARWSMSVRCATCCSVCVLYLLAAVGCRWSRCCNASCRDCRRLPHCRKLDAGQFPRRMTMNAVRSHSPIAAARLWYRDHRCRG